MFGDESRIACTDEGCISEGVPPPKKMVDTVRPGHARGGRGDFGFDGAHKALLIDAAMTDMAIEVAIGTLRQAERPVHIDGERCVVNDMLTS